MFWQGQTELDILYIVVFLGWGLSLSLVLMLPGLSHVALESYRYRRTDAIQMYIGRFLPYALFDVLVTLTRSIAIVATLVAYLRQTALWPSYGGGKYMLLYLAGGVVSLLLLDFVRRPLYGLWAYTFMPLLSARYLDADRLMINYTTLPLLLPLPLLAIRPSFAEATLMALVGVLLLALVLRIVQTLRRLLGSSDGYIYIFLYLCTHELLPWATLALIIRFASQGVLG